jgi:SAM-dependent methyltransferase
VFARFAPDVQPLAHMAPMRRVLPQALHPERGAAELERGATTVAMRGLMGWLRAAFAGAVLGAGLSGGVLAGEPATSEYAFEPVIGMPGKDVVWVPTPPQVIDFMLDMAQATPRDFVVDLGSGDGRLVLGAAKRGIRARGVELNADLVQLSREEAERLGVSAHAEFVVQDMFKADLTQTTVLMTYLLPHLNRRVRPLALAQMKPGTRVVTYAFHMGEWQPDRVAQTGGLTVHLWIVPAAAMGEWRWTHDGIGFGRDYSMSVTQKFQFIDGKASTPNSPVYLRDMKLEGDRITFTLTEEAGSSLAQTVYEGRIDGDTITGTARTNNHTQSRPWKATRVGGRTLIEPL